MVALKIFTAQAAVGHVAMPLSPSTLMALLPYGVDIGVLACLMGQQGLFCHIGQWSRTTGRNSFVSFCMHGWAVPGHQQSCTCCQVLLKLWCTYSVCTFIELLLLLVTADMEYTGGGSGRCISNTDLLLRRTGTTDKQAASKTDHGSH